MQGARQRDPIFGSVPRSPCPARYLIAIMWSHPAFPHIPFRASRADLKRSTVDYSTPATPPTGVLTVAPPRSHASIQTLLFGFPIR